MRHRTDVSDSHSVPSHPVCPIRPSAENTTSPNPDPCTVTDADPVPAEFDRRNTLTLPQSNDIAPDVLPPLSPAVTTVRRVLSEWGVKLRPVGATLAKAARR